MQDLLTQQEKSLLKNGYKKRLIIVFSWAIVASFVVAMVVFIPVFAMIQIKMEDVNKKIETNSSAIKEQTQVLLLPKDVNDKSKIILSFKSASSVSDKLQSVALSKSSGISLNSLAYKKTSRTDNSPTVVQIIISGTASNRESLLSYKRNLEDMNFVKDVSVPVSSFAKDIDLPFTATLTLATN